MSQLIRVKMFIMSYLFWGKEQEDEDGMRLRTFSFFFIFFFLGQSGGCRSLDTAWLKGDSL